MVDVYVLDKNLEAVAVIDAYRSLIWAARYWEIGDCELYLPATAENLATLQIGYYLARVDDPMICRIRRIEIDTDVEEGNYLIVNGVDVKSYLDQRIVWDTATLNGRVEPFIRSMVENSLMNANISGRDLKKQNGNDLLKLGALANLKDVASGQVTYKNVGEKVREYCQSLGWGYRIVLDVVNQNPMLAFSVYKGKDRSSKVIFSPDFENLASSKYIFDCTDVANVALAAGEGEGANRIRSSIGEALGVDRYEIFVDAKDTTRQITYGELRAIYPLQADGGQGYLSGTAYKMAVIDIQILSTDQLVYLMETYPGGVIVTVDDVNYFRLTDVTIAIIPSSTIDDNSIATLQKLIYIPYLLERAAVDLAEHGAVETFSGEIVQGVTYTYREDYNLGDIVTVRNEYGITRAVRITEVIEVNDGNGYRIEPSFENITR